MTASALGCHENTDGCGAHRGRAASQGRASCLEPTWALAPVVATSSMLSAPCDCVRHRKDRLLKDAAAMLVILELVEAGTRRRQEHDVAGNRRRTGPPDGGFQQFCVAPLD